MTYLSTATRCPAPSRRNILGLLHDLVSTYRARKRFRVDLERMAHENPHLIADIGLTKWQVEAEVAKRFWQP